MFLECINSWGVSEVFLSSFFIHKQIIHQLPIIYCLFFVNVYDLGVSEKLNKLSLMILDGINGQCTYTPPSLYQNITNNFKRRLFRTWKCYIMM